MNDAYDISSLTFKDIMKSDKELEYIQTIKNFTLNNTTTEKEWMNKKFMHSFVLHKRDLKLLRFCISHAISDHVDMIEEQENCLESLDCSDETIGEKLKMVSIQTGSLNLCKDDCEITESSSNDNNLLIETLENTTTVIENELENVSESHSNQESLDTLSFSTEISEFYMQNNLIQENKIYWDSIGYDRTPNEYSNNRTSEQSNMLNTIDSADKSQETFQLIPSMGQLIIHYFDDIWYPHSWYPWEINAKLPPDYIDVAVETEDIDSTTSELIWRRLYSNNYRYFSCDFKNCKVLKLKKNHSRSNEVNIFHEIMKREREGYLNEFKVLYAIAWPYYYALPHQDESECAQFECDIDWYLERNPLDYVIVGFKTFFDAEGECIDEK